VKSSSWIGEARGWIKFLIVLAWARDTMKKGTYTLNFDVTL